MRFKSGVLVAAGAVAGAVAMVATSAFGAGTSTGSLNMAAGTHIAVGCPNSLTNSGRTAHRETVNCAASTTTTTQPPTSTTEPVTTTTVPTSNGGGTCSSPVYSGSNPSDTYNTDPAGFFWVNNDAWSGSAGPQSIHVCSEQSWYAVSNQTDQGGQVETYPDTEYDVGARDGGTTTTIAQFNSITSTFAEQYPTGAGENWDAAYDLWTNNWTNETMIWNQWQGGQQYWAGQANSSAGQALTLDGVPYHFYANGSELMFFRDTQVTSGSVDLLAAFQWEVAHGYAKATDVPTQLEYGVEICATPGTQTFPTTGFTIEVS